MLTRRQASEAGSNRAELRCCTDEGWLLYLLRPFTKSRPYGLLPAAALCALPLSLQADMQRASARDAFRAEQGNEHLSALWHAKVAAAQEVRLAATAQQCSCPGWLAVAAAALRSCSPPTTRECLFLSHMQPV